MRRAQLLPAGSFPRGLFLVLGTLLACLPLCLTLFAPFATAPRLATKHALFFNLRRTLPPFFYLPVQRATLRHSVGFFQFRFPHGSAPFLCMVECCAMWFRQAAVYPTPAAFMVLSTVAIFSSLHSSRVHNSLYYPFLSSLGLPFACVILVLLFSRYRTWRAMAGRLERDG